MYDYWDLKKMYEDIKKENQQLKKQKDDLQKEMDYVDDYNRHLKKQKDDVVEYIKNNFIEGEVFYSKSWLKMKKKDLLRMLGEIDE